MAGMILKDIQLFQTCNMLKHSLELGSVAWQPPPLQLHHHPLHLTIWKSGHKHVMRTWYDAQELEWWDSKYYFHIVTPLLFFPAHYVCMCNSLVFLETFSVLRRPVQTRFYSARTFYGKWTWLRYNSLQRAAAVVGSNEKHVQTRFTSLWE